MTQDTPTGRGTPPQLERKPRRGPLLLLGMIALAGLLAVGFTAFRKSVVYYHTPTEVMGLQGKQLRMSGKVAPGSIKFAPDRGTVTFDVTDGRSTVQVLYSGVVPDTLKDDAEAVAEGSLGTDGIFHAVKVLAKCPSKFSGKTTTQSSTGSSG